MDKSIAVPLVQNALLAEDILSLLAYAAGRGRQYLVMSARRSATAVVTHLAAAASIAAASAGHKESDFVVSDLDAWLLQWLWTTLADGAAANAFVDQDASHHNVEAGCCSIALHSVLHHLRLVASNDTGIKWLLAAGMPHGAPQDAEVSSALVVLLQSAGANIGSDFYDALKLFQTHLQLAR